MKLFVFKVWEIQNPATVVAAVVIGPRNVPEFGTNALAQLGSVKEEETSFPRLHLQVNKQYGVNSLALHSSVDLILLYSACKSTKQSFHSECH